MNTVFLLRSNAGWHEREDVGATSTVGRIEAFLSLGAESSLDEAYHTADSQLAEFSSQRVQTDIGITPSSGDVPYVDFSVADTVTVESVSHRVLGMTVTEDEGNGRVIYTPTLNANVILDERERIFNAMRKFLQGLGGGRYIPAQPRIPVYKPQALWPHINDELCETFTKANETWDGSADLEWTINGNGATSPSQDATPLIVSNALTITKPANTPTDYRNGFVTVDETATVNVYATWDVSAVAYDTDPHVVSEEVHVALCAQDNWTGSAPLGDGVVFRVISTGSFGWFSYDCYTMAGVFIFGTSYAFASSPVGSWRMEISGPTVAVYKDAVLFASGTYDEGTYGSFAPAYRHAGICLAGFSSTSYTGTGGPTVDNFCFGDL